jgi:UDP-N-acetyl-D-mannosaminuronic acid dehydrogenase
MKITMVGLGYIGLPNALLHAKAGNKVIGFDIKKETVDKLNKGILPFPEPGLEELFSDAMKNFKATTKIEPSDCFVIAVPTPLESEMKMADLRAVKSAAESISTVLKDGDLVILESTVPPGTSSNFVLPILKKNGVKKILYAHCPERAIPGKTITEMINNDRIVGGIDEASINKVKEMYSKFVKGNLYTTDPTTAEYVKLMENTFRDVNIALANEFALISEDIGVNVWEAIELANKHPRVNILKPGPGVGGHCIAVDPLFMMAKTSNAKIIPIAREINDLMAFHVIKLAKKILKDIEDPSITILGMAYKGNVDDYRESPSFKIEKIALNEGINVVFHDPLVGDVHGNEKNLKKALKNCDLIILATDHDLFKEIDPKKLLVRHKNIIDTRNILDTSRWTKAGFIIKVLGNGK